MIERGLARLGPVMQLAWLPDDFDAALRHWTGTMGVGPFFLLENIKLEDMRYRGAPTDAVFSLALSYWGDTQIELIRPENDAPSIYCGEYAVLGLGGETTINFCTVANYFQGQAQRQTPSVFFTNALGTATGTTKVRLDAKVLNSIIWGSAGVVDELLFENSNDYYPVGATGGSLRVRNSLIRSREYAGSTDAPDKPGLGQPGYGNVLNQDPNFFRSPENGLGSYDFSPKAPSLALGRQRVDFVDADLRNLRRNPITPELGALKQR